MENFLNSIFQNLNLDNFINNWNSGDEKILNDLISNSTKTEYEIIHDSLVIFIKKVNDIKVNNFDYQNARNYEENFSIVSGRLIERLIFEENTNHIEYFIDFIEYCIAQANLLIFSGQTLKNYIIRAKNSQFFEKFSSSEWKRVILCLKKLKFSIFGKDIHDEEHENDQDFKNYRSWAFSEWKSVAENLLGHISKDVFREILTQLQDLYETSMLKASNDSNCPFTAICMKIIREKNNMNDIKSLYITLLTENEAHFEQVLDCIKTVLTNKNSHKLNTSPILSLKSELEYVMNYEAHKPSSFLEKHYKSYYAIILESYLNAVSRDARNVAYTFIRAIIENTIKMKNQDVTFQVWLIEKTQEIAFKVKQYSPEPTESYKDFYDLFYCIEHYIRTNCNSKLCVQPCINLIAVILELGDNAKCLELAGRLLGKTKFFIFKDCLEELQEIFSKLTKLAFKLVEYQENDVDRNFHDLSSALRTCFDNLVEQIQSQPTCINYIQRFLLNNLILVSIDNNYQSNDYFLVILKALNLLDLTYFTEPNDLESIKHLYEAIISDEIFSSIQPDSGSEFYHSRNMFYLQLIRSVEAVFKSRNDLIDLIEPSLLKILDKLHKANAYVNEFDPKQMTINFYILLVFFNALRVNDTHKHILRKFLRCLIDLYKENSENSTVSSLYRSIILSTYQSNAQILSEFSNDFWLIFVDKELSDDILLVIQAILPFDINSVTDRYASNLIIKFGDCVNTTSAHIHSFFNLFKKIATLVPSFFCDELRLEEFIRICAKSNNGIIYFNIVDILNILASNSLISSNDIEILYKKRDFFIQMLLSNQTKSSLIQSGLNYATVLSMYGSFYGQIGLKIGDTLQDLDKIASLIDDLISIYGKLELNDGSQLYLLTTIKNLAYDENRQILLKNHKSFFEKARDNENNSSTREILSSIIDLIEGRSIQVISEKIAINTDTLDKLSTSLDTTESQVLTLKTAIKKQELNVTNIKGELGDVRDKIGEIDERIDEQEREIETLNEKSLMNIPLWGNELAAKLANEWVSIAKHLNFTNEDIQAWSCQAVPFVSMLQEWFTINKSSDATNGLIKVLKELNMNDCVQIITDSLAFSSQNIDLSDTVDEILVKSPPQIFISSTLASKSKAELLQKYLETHHYDVWLDAGQMGGGEMRSKRIDVGLRAAKLILCFITSDFSSNETCLRQVNMAVQLSKPIIPLLVEQGIKWPPAGSLGPILSEYLFIRFYQRPTELTHDERFWPADKFYELKMQLLLNIPSNVTRPSVAITSHPLIFISYQWDKQKQITKLYSKLESIGLSCWFDIKQMGGGDFLYEKIDTGIRNCVCLISCVTQKYALSANCRKEVALGDSIGKPIIPLLLQPGYTYPPPGPMSPTLATLKYIDFTQDLNEQNSWSGDNFSLLLERIKLYMPDDKKTIVHEFLKKDRIKKRWKKANNIVQVVHGSRACMIS